MDIYLATTTATEMIIFLFQFISRLPRRVFYTLVISRSVEASMGLTDACLAGGIETVQLLSLRLSARAAVR